MAMSYYITCLVSGYSGNKLIVDLPIFKSVTAADLNSAYIFASMAVEDTLVSYNHNPEQTFLYVTSVGDTCLPMLRKLKVEFPVKDQEIDAEKLISIIDNISSTCIEDIIGDDNGGYELDPLEENKKAIKTILSHSVYSDSCSPSESSSLIENKDKFYISIERLFLNSLYNDDIVINRLEVFYIYDILKIFDRDNEHYRKAFNKMSTVTFTYKIIYRIKDNTDNIYNLSFRYDSNLKLFTADLIMRNIPENKRSIIEKAIVLKLSYLDVTNSVNIQRKFDNGVQQ